MEPILVRITVVVILAVPFVLLARNYSKLPDELPILRTWDGRPVLWGEKSPLTVFRLPAIGVVTAAAAGVMRRHARAVPDPTEQQSLDRLWLVLIGTACAKALFEGLEVATIARTSRPATGWFGVATVATVAAGLALAATQLPRAWTALKRRDYWRLAPANRWTLVALAMLYVVFAAVPLVLANRHPVSRGG
jgi:hypothetical protein